MSERRSGTGHMHPALIRARQIKALYQRELTALNRNPHLDIETRNAHAERLWRQASEQIERVRRSLEADVASFADDQRSLLDPPRRPDYLGKIE